MVGTYPPAVRARNSYGMFPLSYTTGLSLAIELTKFLIDQYPESLRIADLNGRLPFQGACRNGSIEVVEYLYQLWPEASSVRNFLGDLPVHSVLDYDRDVAAKIRFLTGQWPDCVKELGEHGELPLHRACAQFKPDLSVIKCIFELYPKAIHARTARQKCLPLHCLYVDYEPPKEIIHFLVTQLPYGIGAKDAEGRLPLHYTCAGCFSLEGLKYIIELYPDAIRIESPIHGRGWELLGTQWKKVCRVWLVAASRRGARRRCGRIGGAHSDDRRQRAWSCRSSTCFFLCDWRLITSCKERG